LPGSPRVGSCGYGHFHDLLSPLAARVLVARPGQLRLIFRSKGKNDRNDAERLAKLLRPGEAPAVHAPALEVRAWREPISCRGRVVTKRTRAKNTVRALLRSAGVTPPGQPGLWTKRGLARLRQLAPPAPSRRLRRDLPPEEIEALVRQVRRLEQQLNREAEQAPVGPATGHLGQVATAGGASARARSGPHRDRAGSEQVPAPAAQSSAAKGGVPPGDCAPRPPGAANFLQRGYAASATPPVRAASSYCSRLSSRRARR
jgi:transposase